MSTGTAVQVVLAKEDHTFTLNEEALGKILLNPKVKDSKVIVLSIAGAFRTGKSFVLNFFLRYLQAQGSEEWIGEQDDPLKGFDWRAGSERDTTGILMWSEPFEVKLPDGKKACVLLMDTQGTFDSQSSVQDCATVFALSTMLSSVQVYNIKSNIQENDLQHLQFFVGYGQLALEKSNAKPFQELHFLVRDWQCPYEYEYGREGGENFLKKRLEITPEQHEDSRKLRLQLNSCFEKIECSLLPHPGKEAATSENFDGRLKDIDGDFQLHVQEFVSSLLSTENLVVKEINGKKINGKQLFEYFKGYSKVFQGNELPELKSVYEVTADANNSDALSEALEHYTKGIDLVSKTYKLGVNSKTFEQKHEFYHREAMDLFNKIRKMGGDDKIRSFQDRLEQQINKAYARYQLHNDAKKLGRKKFCGITCCT